MRLWLHRGGLPASTKQVPVGADTLSDPSSLRVSSLVGCRRFIDDFRAAGFRVCKLGVLSARSLCLSFLPYMICPPILSLEQKYVKGLSTVACHFSQTKFSGSLNSGRCLRSPLGERGSPETHRGARASQLLPI